jgi:ankyrin repeat protein
VIVCHDDAGPVDAVRDLLSPGREGVERFGEYSVIRATHFPCAVLARIEAPVLFDAEAFAAALEAAEPRFLSVEAFSTQVGEAYDRHLEGGERRSKDALLAALRAASPDVDLYFAATGAETRHLRARLEAGNLDLDTRIDGAPLLFHLMQTGSVPLLELAIARGADVTARIEDDRWIELQSGKRVNIFRIRPGMTLVHVAVLMSAPKLLTPLVEVGIDVNARDGDGLTAIQLAAEEKARHALVPGLVAAGADINEEDPAGMTPLFRLLASDEFTFTKLIERAREWIDLGADITHVDGTGGNALGIARAQGPKLEEFVRSYGVTTYGVSAAAYASDDPFENVRRAIDLKDPHGLAAHFDPDRLDRDQQTKLLHDTAESGWLEGVRALVEAGLPPQLHNEGGYFADEMAREQRRKDVAAFLKDALKEFRKTARTRAKAARPLFDALVAAFGRIEQGESGEQALAEFAGHPFVERHGVAKLVADWARFAAPEDEGVEVVTFVDHDLVVTVCHANVRGGYFEARIETEGEPRIVDIWQGAGEPPERASRKW